MYDLLHYIMDQALQNDSLATSDVRNVVGTLGITILCLTQSVVACVSIFAINF